MIQPGGLHGIVHVVDDDRAFRTAIGRLLRAAGHDPRLHASALEYLAVDDSDGPACLLLDLRMPGVTGLDLQAALAQRERAHPVIFLSGHGDIPSLPARRTSVARTTLWACSPMKVPMSIS